MVTATFQDDRHKASNKRCLEDDTMMIKHDAVLPLPMILIPDTPIPQDLSAASCGLPRLCTSLSKDVLLKTQEAQLPVSDDDKPATFTKRICIAIPKLFVTIHRCRIRQRQKILQKFSLLL